MLASRQNRSALRCHWIEASRPYSTPLPLMIAPLSDDQARSLGGVNPPDGNRLNLWPIEGYMKVNEPIRFITSIMFRASGHA